MVEEVNWIFFFFETFSWLLLLLTFCVLSAFFEIYSLVASKSLSLSLSLSLSSNGKVFCSAKCRRGSLIHLDLSLSLSLSLSVCLFQMTRCPSPTLRHLCFARILAIPVLVLLVPTILFGRCVASRRRSSSSGSRRRTWFCLSIARLLGWILYGNPNIDNFVCVVQNQIFSH